jgi:hypothetical protein
MIKHETYVCLFKHSRINLSMSKFCCRQTPHTAVIRHTIVVAAAAAGHGHGNQKQANFSLLNAMQAGIEVTIFNIQQNK